MTIRRALEHGDVGITHDAIVTAFGPCEAQLDEIAALVKEVDEVEGFLSSDGRGERLPNNRHLWSNLELGGLTSPAER